MDKSIVYDFMSSMQESNDEEQLMLKRRHQNVIDNDDVATITNAAAAGGIKSMSADELDDQTSPRHADANDLASGAKSDNEALTHGKIRHLFKKEKVLFYKNYC